jgi:hypothetical protein
MMLTAYAVSQSVFTYSDSKGDLSIRAKDGQGILSSGGYEFDLKGSVSVSSKKRQFVLTAGRVKASIGKSAGSDSPNDLKRATASGGARIIQTASGRSSRLQSNTATYTAQGNGATVQANGAVRIVNVDQAKRETMTATGSRGTAKLDPNSPRGISSATLDGPVRVEIVQSAGTGSKVVFTGNRMNLSGNQVSLTGNVKASGAGASRFGNLSNVDSIVVTLNERGEFSRFTFRSGAGK